MVDDKSIVNDFTDEDLTLVSIHSSSSSESEEDMLEGNNSLENCSNSGVTNNDHTNDTIEDEMTTTTFASSFQSTPLLIIQMTIIQMMQWKMQRQEQNTHQHHKLIWHISDLFQHQFSYSTTCKTILFILFYVQSIAVKQQSYK